MKKNIISEDVKLQVEKIVTEFNNAQFKNPERGYQARFRGRFLYLDRCDLGKPSEVCRLAYQGSMDNWEFAIYLHSKERYDPNEWFFPGSEFEDGTLQGAMRAGLEAYPIMSDRFTENPIVKIFIRFNKRRY